MTRIALGAPVAGWLIDVRDVPDPVFSEGMMGAGVAIDPTEGTVVAPCSAQVLMVPETRHAVTLRTDGGAELLIHIGLETVALQGRGFEAHVRDGDKVSAGDRLISFDLDSVGLEAKSLVTPILVTNPDEFRITLEKVDRLVEQGQPIAWLEAITRAAPLPSEGEGRTAEAMIQFEHGIHARPAARIADCAKRYSGEISIRFGEKSASARSPVAIMALNVKKGDRVLITASGSDAAEAVEAIAALVSAGEQAEPRPAAAKRGRKRAANEIAGVTALPGVAVGTAVHWRREVSEIAEHGRGVGEERAALAEACAIVRARLQANAKMSGPAGSVSRAHIGLLDDEELNAAAVAEIERGRSAARAWQTATADAAEALGKVDNPLLRERVADLDDIAAQVTAVLAGDADSAAVELPENSILLADELLPSELMSLPRDRLTGLATAGGGATSHMALIAASFGIPTVVAMGPELSLVADGARVLLDASAGILVVDPDEELVSRSLERAGRADFRGECATGDGERIKMLANLGGLADVEVALAAGAEGCGLLRTEFLFLDRADAPPEEEQRSTYQSIADALEGRPLTIRTLDIGGDKPVPYIRFPHEHNPALGARGVRTQLLDPELIDEQLRAIARVSGDSVKVMLPMVSSLEELRFVRERLAELRKDLPLGVMVETPAAALIAVRLAAEADFLSIGSNDLAQYVLAMDRTNPLLAASIDALHPAVLRLIAMTAEAGLTAGKPVSLCGSLASEPLGALVLIGLGIRELSAVPAALPAVRQAIGQVSASDCGMLAQRALELESASEVRALASELLHAPSKGESR